MKELGQMNECVGCCGVPCLGASSSMAFGFFRGSASTGPAPPNPLVSVPPSSPLLFGCVHMAQLIPTSYSPDRLLTLSAPRYLPHAHQPSAQYLRAQDGSEKGLSHFYSASTACSRDERTAYMSYDLAFRH